ncbi:MAG: methyltransferase domain-containing protein [Proteobacteria bacterium]|nr:methyltransferase domain-containing protein [Pseudomonadota bacterium]
MGAPESGELGTDLTPGTLLGGRVQYAQPRTGFRSGIEPVLLAAWIPARAGEHVLEAGSGAGAALLCLAARVPGVRGTGLERAPELVALATHNARANGFGALSFQAGDVLAADPAGPFDHACANPPYHPDGGPASPVPAREAAKRGGPGGLAAWTAALARRVRPGGSVSLVLTAAGVPEVVAAMAAAGIGGISLLALWPKPERAAKLVLLRGVKGGRGPFRLLPGLVLHHPAGGFTPAAEAVLRDGAALQGAAL